MALPQPTDALKMIRERYGAKDLTTNLRLLIYGTSGSGKTYSLRTAKTPLWIDSFDPGGSTALNDMVQNGSAVVITEYENEDAKHPSAFKLWDDNFDKLESANVFEKVGTYVLDSATTWAQAVLNEVLKRSGRAGGVPQQNDWYPQMTIMEAAVKRILSLPCDVVFICHDDVLKDELTGRVMRAPLLTGKSRKRIPLLFSEIYFADVRRTPKGNNYVWQMRKDATNEARSRLAGIPGSVIEDFEPQDFRALMQKFKRPYENMAPLN